MAEVLVVFDTPIWEADRRAYTAQVCGRSLSNGQWEGWVEFFPIDSWPPMRTARETLQPSYVDIAYWAQRLTLVYLEGALARARALLKPRHRPAEMPVAPAFAEPASSPPRADAEQEERLESAPLYSPGEQALRQALMALSRNQLNAILDTYQPGHEMNRPARSTLSHVALVDIIVATIQGRLEHGAGE